MGFPGGADGKESACNAGDLGLIPGLERPHGGGHGNQLQYSCLETLSALSHVVTTLRKVFYSITVVFLLVRNN